MVGPYVSHSTQLLLYPLSKFSRFNISYIYTLTQQSRNLFQVPLTTIYCCRHTENKSFRQKS